MLEKEFKYYLDHQAKLVEQYEGKYIAIIGEEVIGQFESEEEAFFNLSEKYEPGTFLIQYCEKGDSSYTQTFHSRVSFV